MRSAKVRKMDRKAKHKAQAVAQTAKSRQRRLDNKAKRAEIHAINPDAKITIVDSITYMNGVKVKVINGQIKSHLNTTPLVNETVEVFNSEIEEVEAVEVNDISKFQKLVKNWRL